MGDGERNMVDALAPPGDEARDRRFGRRRLKELNSALSDLEHHYSDPLVLDQFLGIRSSAKQSLEDRHRRPERLNRDSEVMNLHGYNRSLLSAVGTRSSL